MSVEAFRARRHICISICDSLVAQDLYNFELWSVTERNIRRTQRIQPVTWDESSDDGSGEGQGEREGEGEVEEELPLARARDVAELPEEEDDPLVEARVYRWLCPRCPAVLTYFEIGHVMPQEMCCPRCSAPSRPIRSRSVTGHDTQTVYASDVGRVIVGDTD